MLIRLGLGVLLILFGVVSCEDHYTEELLLSRLPSGNVLSHFRFVITSPVKSTGANYSLFPRVIKELTRKYNVSEMSLSLGQGRWWAEEWGAPPQPSSPTGAFVLARISDDEKNIDEKWKSLVNSLNGVFCTSLSMIVPTMTSSPKLSFKPHFPESKGHLRHGAISQETVCTENLTPWKKLLPCKQNGLTTLLNPLKLYAGVYHSMGFNLNQICKDESCDWRLEMNLNLVSDVDVRSKKTDFDLESIFGRRVHGHCSAADSSTIIVKYNQEVEELDPLPSSVLKSHAIYSLTDNNTVPEFNLHSHCRTAVDFNKRVKSSYVSLYSQFGGTDQFRGVMLTSIKNPEMSVRATFLHMVPWFVKMDYHTLELICEHSNEKFEPQIYRRNFVPALSRRRSALVEFDFELPASSTCTVQVQFQKAFLRLREYPPDANHGMYVSPAMLTIPATHIMPDTVGTPSSTVLEDIGRTSHVKTDIVLHSNALLVVLPVPDFSMPFNVICFVLTAISLCFGPIHNFSTKILIPVNVTLPKSPKYAKIFRMFLFALLLGACYAQYYEIGLNEMRRSIEKVIDQLKDSFERMNSL